MSDESILVLTLLTGIVGMVIGIPAYQKRTEARLARLGRIEVPIESSWAAARRRLEVERFDALVLDLRMPGACGFALLDIARFGHGTPLVVVTADAETASRARALGAAVVDETSRSREDLLAAIDRAVSARG